MDLRSAKNGIPTAAPLSSNSTVSGSLFPRVPGCARSTNVSGRYVPLAAFAVLSIARGRIRGRIGGQPKHSSRVTWLNAIQRR